MIFVSNLIQYANDLKLDSKIINSLKNQTSQPKASRT